MPGPTPKLPSPALPTNLARAYFKALLPGGAASEEIKVLFNPVSLQHTASNTLKEEGSGAKKKQFVDKSSSKLTMQLVFDTTDTGVDVRTHTMKMLSLLKPVKQGSKQVPPNVEFGWGAYKFTGLVEQYKETLDFFSSQGTPLRANIDITLSSQDIQFESGRNPKSKVDGQLSTASPAEPAMVPNPPASGPTGAANGLGDPRAARAIASANNADSLRFGGGGELAIGAGIDLRAEAAFSVGGGIGLSAGAGAGLGIGGGLSAGAGAGLSIGGGAGFSAGAGAGAGFSAGAGAGFSAGAGAGFSAGAGAGFSAGAGAGFSAGAGAGFSAGASAGFSAGAGASFSAGAGAGASFGSAVASGGFAGLRSPPTVSASLPDVRATWSTTTTSTSISSGSSFEVGGKAMVNTGSALSADVGATADINAMIRFG